MGWMDDGQSSTVDARSEGARAPRSRGPSTAGGSGGGPPSAASSAGSSPMARARRRLGLRPAETGEERIRKARERAADRLAPVPLSDSCSSRLRRLKDRKAAVEGGRRGRVGGGVTAGGRAAAGSDRPGTAPGPADADGRRELGRAAGSFLASSALNAVVLALRRRHGGALGSPSASWASLGPTRGVYLGLLLDAASVALQSIALRAALTGLLTFAFDAVDFGQRRFVSNMAEGRRLFATEARRLSRLAAAFVALASFTTASVGWLVKLICSLERGDTGSVFSKPLFGRSEIGVLPQGWDKLPGFAINKLSTTFFAGIVHPVRNWSFVEAFYTKFQSIFEFGCCELASTFEFGFLTWGANAQAMSAYMALRLVVFVAALVVMGGIVLPKRYNSFESHGRSGDDSFECSEIGDMIQVPGSLDNSESNRSILSTINVTRGQGGNLSSTMETITEHHAAAIMR